MMSTIVRKRCINGTLTNRASDARLSFHREQHANQAPPERSGSARWNMCDGYRAATFVSRSA